MRFGSVTPYFCQDAVGERHSKTLGAHHTLDYLDMFEQNYSFFTKNEDFGQTGTGSKTQNVEELSLDLIFHNHF